MMLLQYLYYKHDIYIYIYFTQNLCILTCCCFWLLAFAKECSEEGSLGALCTARKSEEPSALLQPLKALTGGMGFGV